MTDTRAEAIIELLGLEPHPEGGYFRETFRDPARVDGRSASTAIYYLLKAGGLSRWHRVDAAEIWHHYAGAALELTKSSGQGERVREVLGIDLAAGQRPQIVIPTGVWQTAKSMGEWTLVGCTVAPGFKFSGFEMAPAGWEP